jgi:DNA-binding NtrC family response regulator
MSCAVLIIEDETTLARNLALYLERYQYQVETAESAEAGMVALESFKPDVVLLDHNLPRASGLEVLERIVAQDPRIRVVMMTGYGSTDLAVQAMKKGAADFLTKPLVLGELKLLLERLTSQDRLVDAIDYYAEREAKDSGADKIVGESPQIRQLRQRIAAVIESEQMLAQGDAPAVLIHGETGTGKELVARALHFDGQRRAAPFMELNCGALPGHLIEAELFGYERGAFTDAHQRKPGLVETAEGGTVFLDEIGETELQTQVKLLKLLEEKAVRRLGGLREQKVNVRIISATNRSLEEMVQQRLFRADLFFRLRIVELRVPPLRDRGSDVLLLARHFLALHGGRYRKPGLRLSGELEAAMLRYHWPGNVRELRNSMEQAVLLATDNLITSRDLSFSAGMAPMVAAPAALAAAPLPQDEDLNLERMERRYIERALSLSVGNVSQAARLLGISRDTLRYRLDRLEIRPREPDLG